MSSLDNKPPEEFGGARYWNTATTRRKIARQVDSHLKLKASKALISESFLFGANPKAATPEDPAQAPTSKTTWLSSQTKLSTATRTTSSKGLPQSLIASWLNSSTVNDTFTRLDSGVASPTILPKLVIATPQFLLQSSLLKDGLFEKPDIPAEKLPAEKSPSAEIHIPSMAPSLKDNPTKRKATEEPNTPSDSKRIKSSHSDSEEPEQKIRKGPNPIPFPEKPAVIEERNGEIEFRVVNNDNQRESLIILTGLKCIFQKQLPKMPKDYIARLVYDRTHLSMAIVKKPLEVVGGITYRPFKGRKFAEIVFCAISSDQQVKGYGAHLMSHLKDYVKATSDVMHFLTYADNYAIGYFKKQGFTKEITLEKPVWMGYIKDYEGGTIMQCSMLNRVRYLEQGRMLLKQKEAVHAKIRAFSQSHVVHQPPKEWKNGPCKIDPLDIPAIRASGWSPDMDELARQPRHGPNYNQLLHLLNDLQNHQSAWPFLNPVNRDDVADYYDVIKEPMDLSTMEVKLEADNYLTPEDFIRDAKLIFDNCRKYNNETTPYAKSANKLEKFMWAQIKAIPEWSHLEPE